jgi:PAS domain S-box-containing protein
MWYKIKKFSINIYGFIIRFGIAAKRKTEKILSDIPNWDTREKDHPAFIRYGVVVVLCLLVFIVKKMLGPVLGDNLPFMLFFSAILLSSWYGGMRPGILATVLSAIIANVFFLLPSHITSSFGVFVATTLFLFEGVLIAGISNSMHKAVQIQEEKDRFIQYYASIAQNISDAVISTNMDDKIQSWNKGAESLYGWQSYEVIGSALSEVVHTTYGVQQKKEMREELLQEGNWKGELSHKRKNGSRVFVLTSMSLLRDEDNKPLGIVSVNRDISDRKKLEQGKDDFIALASHELKTPLTSTKLYIDVLKQRFEDTHDKKSLTYLLKINDQVRKLLELVNYLLDVSKVQAGKLQFTVERTHIDTFVREVVRDIEQLTETHHFHIEGKTEAYVLLDKDRLRQVLVNILNNSIKYSSQANKVDVSIRKENTHIIVSIRDFGIGIPKEKHTKIFERFYQVDDSKGYTYSGIGLGLYISKEIIEKHNGKIWVESEEGRGSTFYFSLPIIKS